jgi:hypothetical protein
MSTTIDQSFVKQFEAEVHLEYQRMGSKLRGTIRTKNDVKGSSTTFQKVGKGEAGTKSRHGNVPIMNLNHTPVECILSDHYAGEYVDKLDELKINHDERQVAAQSGAAALGRKTDSLITAAFDTTNNPNNISVAQTWSTAQGPLTLMEIFGATDVPLNDGNAYSVVCFQAWSDLMQLQQFSSSDYVGDDMRPFMGVPAKNWAGLIWFPFSGLPKDGNGDYKQFAYHRSAAGHAIGQDVNSDITWNGEKQAHLVVYSMSQGAVLIDATGVIENVYDVTP